MSAIYCKSPVYPLHAAAAAKSPLAEEHLEELRESWLWTESYALAHETLVEAFDKPEALPENASEMRLLLAAPPKRIPLAQVRESVLRVVPRNDRDILEVTDAILCFAYYMKATGDMTLPAERLGHLRAVEMLSESLDEYFLNHLNPSYGLLRNPDAGGDPTFGVLVNARATIAIRELLAFPGVTAAMRHHWTKRLVNLGMALRKELWVPEIGAYAPCRLTDNILVRLDEYCIYPAATGEALRGGLFNVIDSARSLTVLGQVLRSSGGLTPGFSHCPPCPDAPGLVDEAAADQSHPEWISVACEVAGAWASAGYPGHAMEMLRPVAEAARRSGRFGTYFQATGMSNGAADPAAAAAFMAGFDSLFPGAAAFSRPDPGDLPDANSPRNRMVSAYPPRKLSFRKIEFDEKRGKARLDLEAPVLVSTKGWWSRIESSAILRNPSCTGLGLQVSKPIPEGSTIDLVVDLSGHGAEAAVHLRGRIVWAKPKPGTRMYLSGVELDARSRHLQRWQDFILERAPTA